jgi:hypothetical protein
MITWLPCALFRHPDGPRVATCLTTWKASREALMWSMIWAARVMCSPDNVSMGSNLVALSCPSSQFVTTFPLPASPLPKTAHHDTGIHGMFSSLPFQSFRADFTSGLIGSSSISTIGTDMGNSQDELGKDVTQSPV